MQEQTATWFTTEQTALKPHDPVQGSTQRWLIQAKDGGHSGLMVHSGLQFGGLPL